MTLFWPVISTWMPARLEPFALWIAIALTISPTTSWYARVFSLFDGAVVVLPCTPSASQTTCTPASCTALMCGGSIASTLSLP